MHYPLFFHKYINKDKNEYFARQWYKPGDVVILCDKAFQYLFCQILNTHQYTAGGALTNY